MKCAICGNEINNEFGNNPWPVRTDENARCCDECNTSFVIPYRIMLMRLNKKRKDELMQELNTMTYEKLKTILINYYSE